jgi:hypothetical protein
MIERIKQASGSMRFWMIVLGGAITAANTALKILDDATLIALLALLGVGAGADTLRPMGTPTK